MKNILEQRQQNGLYRKRNIINENQLSFSNNDYLGLANHPEVVRSYKNGLDKYGASSSASQLLGGYSLAHRLLEEELAEFLGYESVLLFSTGYMANLGVITSLFKEDIFIDRLCHASIIDGCLYSKANSKRYKHLDSQDLEKLLKKSNAKSRLIISEGVFSMDGDIAALSKLVEVAQNNNSWLMLDDAHGIGVLGKEGKGSIEHWGKKPQILVGTFGKAFGTFGAFVASSKFVIESLVQFARTYIYTTALPAAICEATHTSLKLLQTENWRREYLNSLIKKFKERAEQLNLPLLPSDTPIQSLIIGDAYKAKSLATQLEQQGITVALVRPPTVPANTSRLRISLNVNHTENDIERLLEVLGEN